MSRLESVQNAPPHVSSPESGQRAVVRRCEHITPALRQLHWLPVRRRVDFKISTLVYRSLAGTAPVYVPLTNVRSLLLAPYVNGAD